ncbi:MAG: hypothetical protein ACYTKC_05110 [Planctomycetota bacterium]
MARNLTEEECRILKMIQGAYGPQNTAEDVLWAHGDEAILWVKTRAGSTAIMANLTNLAKWRADGTIVTDEELRRDWLQIKDT